MTNRRERSNFTFIVLILLSRIKKMKKSKWRGIIGFCKDHRFLCVTIGYVLVVMSFAFVNWVMFMRNSTSYLISEQLNKHVERYEFLASDIDLAAYHRDAKDSMPITIGEFSELIKPDFERLELINDSLIAMREIIKRDSVKLDSLGAVAEENRKEAIKSLKENYLSKLRSRIDSLRTFMDGRDSTDMIIQGKYIEMAELQYEYAKKNAQVQSYISNHYGGLIPENLSLQISELLGNDIRLTSDVVRLENARRAVSSNIKDTTRAFHENRLNSVSFCDFLYYSICVSTTVSFGDIAPNNGSTRFIAILELLICLILVGTIVHIVIVGISREKNKEYK